MNEHEALEMSAQGPPKPRGDRGLLPPKRRICYGLGPVKSDQATHSQANLLMTQARDRACATGEAPDPRGAWTGPLLSNTPPYVVILVRKMHAAFAVTAFAQLVPIRLWLFTVLTALSVNAGLIRTPAQSAVLLSPAWLQLHAFPEALAHSRTNPTPQRLSSANSGRTSSHGDNAQAAAPSSHAPSEARSLAKEGERGIRPARAVRLPLDERPRESTAPRSLVQRAGRQLRVAVSLPSTVWVRVRARVASAS